MLEKNLTQFVLPKDLKLLSIEIKHKTHLWTVEKVRQEFEVCPKCGSTSNVRAGRCRSRVREQGLRDEELYLLIHKHRYFCKPCKKTFTEPVSIVWPRRRTTQRFRKSLAKNCHNYSNLSRVRKDMRVSSGLMYQVYYEQISVKLNEFKGQSWPTVLGIDEHFFRRQRGFREFVTMFTDLKKRRLFEVGLGRSNKSLMEQVKDIPGRENVRVVSIDMSGGYRALVRKLFPNAKVVSDKFHVLRLLNPAIMSAGAKIHGHRQELSTRRKLLWSRVNLDYWQKSDINIYLKDKDELRELYKYKEEMFELYRIKGSQRARRKLESMILRMSVSKVEKVRKLSRTLHKWREEVLYYFVEKWTNAFTEAMNNTGKLVQKQGYGYKSFVNYRLRVLSACIF